MVPITLGAMAQRKNTSNGSPKKFTRKPARKPVRKISKKQQRIYRRRRIVAVIVLLAVIAALCGLVYGVVRGVQAVSGSLSSSSSSQSASATASASNGKSSASASQSAKPSESATSKSATPSASESSTKAKNPGIPNCTASDVSLDLTADTTTVAQGGKVTFKVVIKHDSKRDCVIDASNASRILTITSGDNTVWRSDSCPVDSRQLLMTGSDKDTQTIAWNTTSTGSECQAENARAKVDPGTYVATLSVRDHEKIKSSPVTITVQ
ncbi:hypothetical protein BTIS_1576 [Bifidobacterium tissieri]|uniref:DUF4232 domain-containing protein n=2 Tax=Bifidobacterium tissieri TaxID=1630162 RepID=A0A261FDE5_9BIFI|nr:hypothetical protein BTIS_1576 [Bifidobacterium tissieri]